MLRKAQELHEKAEKQLERLKNSPKYSKQTQRSQKVLIARKTIITNE